MYKSRDILNSHHCAVVEKCQKVVDWLKCWNSLWNCIRFIHKRIITKIANRGTNFV